MSIVVSSLTGSCYYFGGRSLLDDVFNALSLKPLSSSLLAGVSLVTLFFLVFSFTFWELTEEALELDLLRLSYCYELRLLDLFLSFF